MANKSRRGRGSFESQIDTLVEQYSTNTSNWNKRNDALLAMQELFESIEGEANPQIFSVELFRKIRKPLMESLSDLRSQLVKEGCNTIIILAKVAGDLTRPLFRELLPHMIDIVGSGNKVIMSNVDQCIIAVLQYVKYRQIIPYVVDQLRQSKSRELREACAEYICHILQNWSASYLEKDTELLKDAIESATRDASQICRAIARRCFAIYQVNWPAESDIILRKMDQRTQKLLTDAVGEISRSQTREIKSQSSADETFVSQNLLSEELRRGNNDDFNLHAPDNGTNRGVMSKQVQSGSQSNRRDQGWRLQRGEQGLNDTTYNRIRNEATIPFSRSSNLNKSGSKKSQSTQGSVQNLQDESNVEFLSINYPNGSSQNRGNYQNDSRMFQRTTSARSDISTPPPEAFVSPEYDDPDYKKKQAALKFKEQFELENLVKEKVFYDQQYMLTKEEKSTKKEEFERERQNVENQRVTKQFPQKPNSRDSQPSIKSSNELLKLQLSSGLSVSTQEGMTDSDKQSLCIQFNVGDYLALGKKVVGKEVIGVVQFVGETQFAAGTWVGLELESEDGKNDGSVKGLRYFSCLPNRGIFVRHDQLKNLATRAEPKSSEKLQPQLEPLQQLQSESQPRSGQLPQSQPQQSPIDPFTQQMSHELLKYHKIHVDEIMAIIKEEYEILSEFEKHLQAPIKEQLQTYTEAIECCLDQREESCRKLRTQLQTLRLQSFRGRLAFS